MAFGSICVLGLVLCVTMAQAHLTEILVDEDVPSIPRGNSIETFPMPVEDGPGQSCHVEFQVMKRVVGKCMKIGRSSRGCVAGTYLHPFHPECL